MDTVIIISSAAGFLGLICSAAVTISACKNVDKIGDDKHLKRQSLSRAFFNFYAVLALILAILTRALDLIGNDLFIGLFVVILGGLGFKVTTELSGRDSPGDEPKCRDKQGR